MDSPAPSRSHRSSPPRLGDRESRLRDWGIARIAADSALRRLAWTLLAVLLFWAQVERLRRLGRRRFTDDDSSIRRLCCFVGRNEVGRKGRSEGHRDFKISFAAQIPQDAG